MTGKHNEGNTEDAVDDTTRPNVSVAEPTAGESAIAPNTQLAEPVTSDVSTAVDGFTAAETETAPSWLIPGRLYDVLKWLAALVLPALATFVSVVWPAWGLPYTEPIVATIAAFATLCGAIIGASHLKNKMTLAA